ncbi:MAG: DUF7405 family protein [Trebonia sp.]
MIDTGGQFDDATRALSRRRFLVGATALAAGGIAAGLGANRASASPRVPFVPLGGQPHGLPKRQHAWTGTLAIDSVGDPIAPRFARLLFFDVRGRPTRAHARLLEARLRTLERRFHWGPGGLLVTASWGTAYFTHVLGVPSPVPRATRMSSFESPRIDNYHLCLHLACDDERRLAAVEAALVHGARLPGVRGSLSLGKALVWRETRAGFKGAGLPASHQDVRGIPAGNPVSRGAPLFMGFKSGLRKNQATEDDVTIVKGRFAGGTTMHVSYMRLNLDDWYGALSPQDRVSRMFSPQTSVAEVRRITTDAPSEPNRINQAIRLYGVVGHSQTTAQARKRGRPLIIRRDFNTVDGDRAGLHFVAVQRSIDDFVVTRNAMNASGAHLENKVITATANNGINAFIFVRHRANYITPSRAERSFPLLS